MLFIFCTTLQNTRKSRFIAPYQKSYTRAGPFDSCEQKQKSLILCYIYV